MKNVSKHPMFDGLPDWGPGADRRRVDDRGNGRRARHALWIFPLPRARPGFPFTRASDPGYQDRECGELRYDAVLEVGEGSSNKYCN